MLTRLAPNPTSHEEFVNVDALDGKEAAMMRTAKVVELQRDRHLAVLINKEPGAWALEFAGQLRSAGYVVHFIRWEIALSKTSVSSHWSTLTGPSSTKWMRDVAPTLQGILRRLDATAIVLDYTHYDAYTTGNMRDRCSISLVFGFAAALRLETNRRFINVQVDEFNATAARALVQILEKVMDRDLHRPDLDQDMTLLSPREQHISAGATGFRSRTCCPINHGQARPTSWM
ncbi:hypothetical protein BDV10DRAFT_186592 [Aspergillus recurvatus]